jgi:hypothetical protein
MSQANMSRQKISRRKFVKCGAASVAAFPAPHNVDGAAGAEVEIANKQGIQVQGIRFDGRSSG